MRGQWHIIFYTLSFHGCHHHPLTFYIFIFVSTYQAKQLYKTFKIIYVQFLRHSSSSVIAAS